LETIYQLASQDQELCSVAEARRVRGITGYWNRDGFQAAKAGIERYEEIVPDERGDAEVVDNQEKIRVS
jgi:hypothetical protein